MTRKTNNFVDDKYDYIKIDEKEFNQELEYIKKGFGESVGLILYILKHKKGDFYKKIIRKLDEPLNYDKEIYDIHAKYYVTWLKDYNNKEKEEMEQFDHFKINNIGFYKITNFYKNCIGGLEPDKELNEKCTNYEKNFNENDNNIDDDNFLKINTRKY